MAKLRDKLNPEEHGVVTGATAHPTEINKHPLHCGMCGAIYYVDDRTFEKAQALARLDPSDVPFYCDECEAEYDEEAFAG